MKQITIIAPNEDGLIVKISKYLADEGINIESLNACSVQDRDVVTLIVDDYDRCLLLLRDNGYDAYSEDAQIINIKDEPGALAQITKRLADGGIPLRSIRILHRQNGGTILALAMDRPEEGLALIQDLLIETLS